VLGPYFVVQGFVIKITPAPVKPSPDTVSLPGLGFLDVPRTEALWNQVFLGQAALLRQKRWVDPASAGIPFTYVVTAAALGQVLNQQGRTAEGTKMFAAAREIAQVAGLEGYLGPLPQTPRGKSGDTALN